MFIGHEQLMILVIDILKNQQERILAGEFIVFRGKIPGSGIGAAAVKMMAFIIAGMLQEFQKLLGKHWKNAILKECAEKTGPYI